MSFEFIEPLTEKPKLKRRIARTTPLAELVVREFKRSNVRYAKVSFNKLKGNYKSPGSCARAIGRTLKRLKLNTEIEVYSDDNNVYLEKVT